MTLATAAGACERGLQWQQALALHSTARDATLGEVITGPKGMDIAIVRREMWENMLVTFFFLFWRK